MDKVHSGFVNVPKKRKYRDFSQSECVDEYNIEKVDYLLSIRRKVVVNEGRKRKY